MLKIGIIGAGRIGKVHLESISYHVKNATVTAMADPFMNEETEKLIRSYGVSKVTKDYKDILNDKDIDAVLVCSSTAKAPFAIFMVMIAVSTSPCSPMAGSTSTAEFT